jgi:hypothetical protein
MIPESINPAGKNASRVGSDFPDISQENVMNPKVLIVVSGGVAWAYADAGVDVVIADFDHLKAANPADIQPIHARFQALMALAGIAGDWPVSENGVVNDALRQPEVEGGIA